MAEGQIPFESKILCRYYVHGACRKGDNCNYSHDRHNPVDNVCKYYIRGSCTFGDRCRYDHIKPRSNFQPESQKKSTPLKPVPQKSHVPPPVSSSEPITSGMVSLKKALNKEPSTPTTPKPPEEWVKASEFVPGQPFQCSSIPNSYAHAAANNLENTEPSLSFDEVPVVSSGQLLCPFSADRECPYGDECEYRHGDVCDLCGLAVLLPGDEKQNLEHRQECLQQHERDMELSFAIARSKDKQCGVCMDIVLEKQPTAEQRFGILSDCSHCFCLACIRKWRASKQFDSKTIRSCPECRVQSDFVTPSAYWVDTKEDKIKLIQGYKQALGKKPCKYFDKGRGECPFNEKCFYLHMNPDGTKAEPNPRR
ncbi:probable E3 ubiquitin-protein ligase makorin-1 [Mya arenaria]|nr:probable E3 ubiquitin-protein ligase makorin-1 [Mya arenaria]